MAERIIRPKWPYDRWKTENELDRDSEQLDNDKHVSFESSENDGGVGTGLGAFLHSFDNDLDVFETEDGLAVQKEINAVLEATVSNLKKNHRLFKPCRLLKAGSVAEGTKVGEMNEFDFLLVLDIFQRKDLFNICLTENEMIIHLTPCEDAEYLVRTYPEYFDIFSQAERHSSSQHTGETGVRNADETDYLNVITEKDVNDVSFEHAHPDAELGVGLADTRNAHEFSKPVHSDCKLGELDSGTNDLEATHSRRTTDKSMCDDTKEDMESARQTCPDDNLAKDITSLDKNSVEYSVNEKANDCGSSIMDSDFDMASSGSPGTVGEEGKKEIIIAMKNIRECLVSLFLEEFRKNLSTYTNWELFEFEDHFGEKRICKSDIATTLHLTSEKYNLDVDIDVCLCIPISDDEGETVQFINNLLVDCRPYFNYIKSIMQREPKEEVFAIIGEKGSSDVDTSSTRITVPRLEQSHFLYYGRNSGQVKTYRYAKCIAGRFFPKATKYDGCPKCCHSFVKSYYLKNIIFYMINNYKDPSLWSNVNVPYRVFEVFDILATSIPNPGAKEFESDYATVATFSTPGQLQVDRIYNYNPCVPIENRTRGIDLFIEDLYEPFYELSFLPEYEEGMKIGDILIDETVIRYFDVLKNALWDSYGLILEVKDILRKMKTKHDVTHDLDETHST